MSKREMLKQRAAMLAEVRAFFAKRDYIEVDTPALSRYAPVDAHIDVIATDCGYLHTSPEYGMKQLLAEGAGDIYQMSHVFRKEESGPLHTPEFTMIEWYRVGWTFNEFIAETLDLIRLFLGSLPTHYFTYREALQRFAGIDPASASTADLLACAKQHYLNPPADAVDWDRDTLLQLIMSFVVEPHLGKNSLAVITDYPSSQAALSQIVEKEGVLVAERFEVYASGIELANGYHELTDAKEQRKRFIASNEKRLALGKEALPIDETFLAALERGLPDCCGVAAGFDRLLMLRLGHSSIHSILPLI